MTILYRPLEILSRAIHFKNLTAASVHVGLSQPQLSRVLAQLEEELQISLLDRGAKRKSAWTPAAFRLAAIFEQSTQKLGRALQELQEHGLPTEIHAACLEGLAPLAVRQMGKLQKKINLQLWQLNVLDLTELEERLLSGDLDLVWTSRVPGKAKPSHYIELGYQTLELKESGKPIDILSPYQYGRRRRRKRLPGDNQIFISNSLVVRQMWLESVGGSGHFPSSVVSERQRGMESVVLLGSESLHHSLWEKLIQVI